MLPNPSRFSGSGGGDKSVYRFKTAARPCGQRKPSPCSDLRPGGEISLPAVAPSRLKTKARDNTRPLVPALPNVRVLSLPPWNLVLHHPQVVHPSFPAQARAQTRPTRPSQPNAPIRLCTTGVQRRLKGDSCLFSMCSCRASDVLPLYMAWKDGEGTVLWAAVDAGAVAGFDFLTFAVSAAC